MTTNDVPLPKPEYPPCKSLHFAGNAMEPLYTADQMRAYGDERERVALARVAELEAKLAEAEKDARRYQWLRDMSCCSMTIYKNDGHAPNYMSLAEWIECSPDLYDDVPPEELERMKAAGTDWAIQVYPSTPVGFYVWHAATLDAVVDAAIAAGAGDE